MGFKRKSSARAVSVSTRATLRSAGESVQRHAVTNGEVSRGALPLSPKSSAGPGRPASNRLVTSGRSGHVGADTDRADEKRTSIDREQFEISRATCRIRISVAAVQDGEQRNKLIKSLDQTRFAYIRGMNACIHALWKEEGARLVEWQKKNPGKIPKAKDWPRCDTKAATGLNLYALVREVSPELSTHMAAYSSHQALKKWNKERYSALVFCDRSPPHFRNSAPFTIPAAAFRIVHQGADLYEISFSLTPGRHPGGAEFRIPVRARDRYMRETLTGLTSGQWKKGTISLMEHPRKKLQWSFRIAYTRLVPRQKEGYAAAINRGVINFLVAVLENGQSYRYSGADIEAHLARTTRRRRKIQSSINGTARVGRGRARALKAIERLSGKSARWRDTKNQVLARRFAKWCVKNNVNRVYLDSMKGIRRGTDSPRIHTWRYDDLGHRITSCLEEYGIETIENDAMYISQTCPECGNVDPGQVNSETRMFRCKSCGHTGDMDEVAGKNNLARGIATEAQGA